MKLTTKNTLLNFFCFLLIICSCNSKVKRSKQVHNRGRNICMYGRSQSPINFSNSPIILKNPLIQLKYDSIVGDLKWYKNCFRIQNSRKKSLEQYITFTTPDGKFSQNYYLTAVKFKVKGEHKINNYHPKLEIQLVHRSNPNDDSSVLFNYKRLTMSLLLDDDETNQMGDEFLKNLRIDGSNELNNLIKEINSSGYFFYYGSLTEEPCTENNIWIVLTKKFTIGKDFLFGLTKMVKGMTNGKYNNRETSPINEREIFLYGSKPTQPGTLF